MRRTLRLGRGAILRTAAARLLGALCDLQIVTSLGILIAGFVQMPEISFYHESIIMNAFWLTLNSFFAARVDYMEDDSKRAKIRQSGILISVILGTAFLCFVTHREDEKSGDWNILVPGRCYLYHDKSSVWFWQGWFWVGGQAFYGVCLALAIIPWTWPIVEKATSGLRHWQEMLITQWTKSAAKLGAVRFGHLQGFDQFDFPRTTKRILIFIFMTLILSLYWLVLQLIAVYSYGDSFYPALMLFYLGFAIWNTFDILDIKLSNRSLVDGTETKWGFGQVLPLVLLIAIVFNTVDAIKGARQEVSNKANKAQEKPI
ncbi:uncharacterized protein KY384_001231 [Bacidia gigantensis]|uniref:uncharacterized protein n=1 Tax=Bacidia gigantensis TaxID=2732470 RepID=UPI001D045937|nr:uncharacterized protein KY384_001231 [Bacidia gigantensis]KAG8534386.1 hypothetical protein KY384_001231 [Bacidia gigantensis]